MQQTCLHFSSNLVIKSHVNWPISVAEVNVLKLHRSQLVEKIPRIYCIFDLQRKTRAENSLINGPRCYVWH